MTGRALHVRGNRPADVAYQNSDAVVVGDFPFMQNVGTALCDVSEGGIHELDRSIHRLLALLLETRLLTYHDYPPEGPEHGGHSADRTRGGHTSTRVRDLSSGVSVKARRRTRGLC